MSTPVSGDASSSLPDWLVGSSTYEPQSDSDSFLRKNVLSLASALALLRAGATPFSERSALQRVLGQMNGSVLLVGTIALVACVSLARNMAFVWLVAAVWLVYLATCPASRIRAALVPALVAGALAFVVNAPALIIGQLQAPMRMCTKAFVTVGLATVLAQTLGPEGIVSALRGCGLPLRAVMVVDLALRDIVLLGESAHSLSEALALRSVGRDRTKTSSAAGVMGVTFLRAHQMATARSEAMELRGYGASVRRSRVRTRANAPTIVYICVMLALVVLFVYLERAMT